MQLIDATEWFSLLRKNLGNKNCALSEDDIRRVCDAFLAFEETEHSKIFPNRAFGYWRVTLERPLRVAVELSPEHLSRFRDACEEADEEPLADAVEQVAGAIGPGPHRDFNLFVDGVNRGVKLTARRKKLLQTALAFRDETAEPVIKKTRRPGKTEPEPMRGLIEAEVNGQQCVVEYEPDSELRDTEQVPLLAEGGVEGFLRREVLPYAPGAWYDPKSVKIGYEISFTRHFYKPQPLRSRAEIRAEIMALERENEAALAEIVGADSK